MGFFVGYLVIAFVLTPIYFKYDLVSIYGYLERRFGLSSYKTGAWFFFISKLLGASVRLFLVCLILQLLVFGASFPAQCRRYHGHRSHIHFQGRGEVRHLDR